MFFNLKVYLLCFKPTKKPLDAAVDLKFATLKIPLSILLINCKVVFFFTQWQATRAVGTTHVKLYGVDNLSTRSPQALTSTYFNAPYAISYCSILQELPFFDLRKILKRACTQTLKISSFEVNCSSTLLLLFHSKCTCQ